MIRLFPLQVRALAGLVGVSVMTLAWQPVALAESVAPGTQPPDPWAGTVELYGFSPWVKATTTVRGFEVDTELTPIQVLNVLQFVANGRASLEHQRLGVMVDAAYTRLGAERSTSSPRGLVKGSAEVTSINGVYDLALRYRFGARESATGQPGRWWVIPYAGMRLVQAQLDVAARLQGQGPLGLRFERDRSLERTWTQPLVGTQASVFVTPGLRVFARGDLGGFGLAGDRDISGNAQAGMGIALGNSTELLASWRYLGLAWSNGADRSTGFSTDQHGVELGLKLLF
ncbi:MAG: hypothetical protein VKN13_08825 [Cyanobacteriota bacterium]|nr:hypothetical protein [Cyanobacteriota bacterium]